MMSILTKDQITDLLQIKTPAEIREQEAERLDTDGERLLEERERHPHMEDWLRTSTRYTRELLARAPEVRLPERSGKPPAPPPLVFLILGATRVPNLLLAFVIPCFAFTGLFFLLPSEDPGLPENRDMAIVKRLADGPDFERVNRALFTVLKERGTLFFMEAEQLEMTAFDYMVGSYSKNQAILDFYEEALADFRQAYQLIEDPKVRDYLIEAQKRSEALLDQKL